jgi:hypothetical protein
MTKIFTVLSPEAMTTVQSARWMDDCVWWVGMQGGRRHPCPSMPCYRSPDGLLPAMPDATLPESIYPGISTHAVTGVAWQINCRE